MIFPAYSQLCEVTGVVTRNYMNRVATQLSTRAGPLAAPNGSPQQDCTDGTSSHC